MEHFYKNIFGYFNFEDIYSEIVEKSNNGSHFVEIGSFFGCSTVYMAVEIINSGKYIKFDSIDNWGFKWNLDGNIVDVYERYLENIKPVKNIINVVKGKSVDMSKYYKDNSLDFVFIDADHTYTGVKDDVLNWYPKVKNDGIIAGHDYIKDYNGVIEAVNDFFGKENVIPRKWSWLVYKQNLKL